MVDQIFKGRKSTYLESSRVRMCIWFRMIVSQRKEELRRQGFKYLDMKYMIVGGLDLLGSCNISTSSE